MILAQNNDSGTCGTHQRELHGTGVRGLRSEQVAILKTQPNMPVGSAGDRGYRACAEAGTGHETVVDTAVDDDREPALRPDPQPVLRIATQGQPPRASASRRRGLARFPRTPARAERQVPCVPPRACRCG
jgi:hypothetical protein